MKLARNGESGQVLILVLILVALVPFLILPMLNQGYTGLKYHQMIEKDTLTTYAADAGIEYGYCEVYNNAADILNSPLEEILNINDATVNVTANYTPSMGAYIISSTATGGTNKSVGIESYVIIDVGLFGNAFACDGDLNISYCDLTADSGGESDIYVNGNVDVDQSNIEGDIFASGTIDVDEQSTYDELHEGAEILSFPTPDTQPHIDAAQAGENYTSGDKVLDGGSHTLGPIYISNGKLDIKGNADVTLAGTVYVNGDVSVSQADISGFGDIVATGSISFSQFTYTANTTSILPLILTTTGDLSVSQPEEPIGTYDMDAVLYAPDGTISMSHTDLRGSVAADTIDVSWGNIHYPAAIQGRPDLPGAGLETISYGYK